MPLRKSMHRPGVRLAMAIAGTALSACATNFFIVPMHLYSGGIMGICQLLRTLLLALFHLEAGRYDFAGALYLMMNVPLLLLGYKSLGKMFFRNTLVCTMSGSLFLSILPIPTAPLVADRLTGCLLGGILSGTGIGLMLTCGCCSGGSEVLGMFFSKRNPALTVGRFNRTFNMLVYGLCLILFDPEVAIYSVIYSTFQSMVVDRAHQQNINVQGAEGLEEFIIEKLHRGVTSWDGEGSFTHQGIQVLCTVLSKYEIGDLRQAIHEIDPKAFFIVQEGVHVGGNFAKKLA